jgi:hypothetical protein
VVEPFVYKAADHASQPAAEAAPAASAAATPPSTPTATKKKPGFFTKVGKFFRRVFGAE